MNMPTIKACYFLHRILLTPMSMSIVKVYWGVQLFVVLLTRFVNSRRCSDTFLLSFVELFSSTAAVNCCQWSTIAGGSTQAGGTNEVAEQHPAYQPQ